MENLPESQLPCENYPHSPVTLLSIFAHRLQIDFKKISKTYSTADDGYFWNDDGDTRGTSQGSEHKSLASSY